MSVILLIVTALAILYAIFYLANGKIKKAERKNQEEMKRDVSEQVMSPQRKLHEKEKKRWEDEYWKSQVRRKK